MVVSFLVLIFLHFESRVEFGSNGAGTGTSAGTITDIACSWMQMQRTCIFSCSCSSIVRRVSRVRFTVFFIRSFIASTIFDIGIISDIRMFINILKFRHSRCPRIISF